MSYNAAYSAEPYASLSVDNSAHCSFTVQPRHTNGTGAVVNKQLKPGNDNLQNDKYDNYYLKPQ